MKALFAAAAVMAASASALPRQTGQPSLAQQCAMLAMLQAREAGTPPPRNWQQKKARQRIIA
jgi:hypothetical protein